MHLAGAARLLPQPGCRSLDSIAGNVSQAPGRHRSAYRPSGRTFRNSTIAKSADERGGTTPFNLLPISTGGQPGGAEHHPAATPYDVAAWWCRYILATRWRAARSVLWQRERCLAGLDHGASKVIGIEKEKKYLAIAKRRIIKG